MNTCPMCGEDFPEGGAFYTHVNNCDSDPETPSDGGLKAEVKRLRERLNRLEDQFVNTPGDDEFNTLWRAVMETDGRVPSNSRLRDYENGLEQLRQLRNRLDSLFANCPACGAEIPAPSEPGEGECPECETAVAFDSSDIPTKSGSNGEVRTTR